MLRILFFLICSTLPIKIYAQEFSNFDNTVPDGESGQTIAFIGEKLGLYQIETHCPEDHICLDARFNARYKISELLIGEHSGDIIDFAVYDHYGFPKFSTYDNVVIYLYQSGNQLFHHKYQFDVLHRTAEGGYAYCGDPYAGYWESEIKENGREDLTALSFHPAVTDLLP